MAKDASAENSQDADGIARTAAAARPPEFPATLSIEAVRVPESQLLPLAVRLARELHGPGIFVTPTGKAARTLAVELHEAGITNRIVHAQMRARDRAQAVQSFLNHEVPVLVAAENVTLPQGRYAIGYVVHAGAPADMDTYWAQASLAGMEGRGRAILLFDRRDKRLKTLTTRSSGVPTLAEAELALARIRTLAADGDSVEAADLSDPLKMPLRRIRNLLQVLREAGAIRAVASGAYEPAGHVEAAALQEALRNYRDTHQDAESNLKEVLAFAESSLCRRKVVRRYFGEEEAEACGICDNCRRGTEERMRRVTRQRRARALARPEGGAPRQWSRGDLVQHDTWGEGEVKQVWGDKIRVHFPGQGEKVLKAEFVHPA